jgi:L-threonylcarbamoyladenylate synthase
MPNVKQLSQSQAVAEIIRLAAEVLKNGGVVAAPTETRYGLLASIENPAAVKRIFELKKRDFSLPTAIFVGSRDEIWKYGRRNRIAQVLAEKFLPGPLTLILESLEEDNPPIIVDGKIGIRISSSPIIGDILRQTSLSLTATSANISGEKEPETISELIGIFGSAVDLYVDGGPLTAPASTIVDCVGSTPKMLRAGSIKESEILSYLGEKV